MTGGRFSEVNRRRRSRRGIREIFPQLFDRSRTPDASVSVCLLSVQYIVVLAEQIGNGVHHQAYRG